MKNVKIIAICLLIFATSCKKETSKPTKKSPQNLSEFIASLQNYVTPDFFVLVSSVYNNSPMDTGGFNPDFVGLVIQAGEMENNDVGYLSVGDTDIEFADGYYSRQVMMNQLGFFGNALSFNLSGQDFPSFSLVACSPMPTKLTFEGLEENYYINLNGVEVNWTPDFSCNEHDLNNHIILYSDDNLSNSHFVAIPVSDFDGSLYISHSILSEFSDFETLNIVYLRGSQNIHQIDGKKIDLRFIQLSSTKFVIAK